MKCPAPTSATVRSTKKHLNSVLLIARNQESPRSTTACEVILLFSTPPRSGVPRAQCGLELLFGAGSGADCGSLAGAFYGLEWFVGDFCIVVIEWLIRHYAPT